MPEGDIYLGIDPSDRGFNAVALQDDKIIGHWKMESTNPLGSDLVTACNDVIQGCWKDCPLFHELPIRLAIEAIQHITPGMTWPALCPTMRMEGAIAATFWQKGAFLPVFLTRQKIKQCLLGKASGTDADVRAYLLQDIGGKGTKAKPGPLYGLVADDFAALAAARALQTLDKIDELKAARGGQ